jgi:alpha-galactosidase
MNLKFDIASGLSIQGEWIGLEKIYPVLNGNILRETSVNRLVQGENAFALQYTAAELKGGIFTLELVPEGQERCRIRFHLKNYLGILDTFGIFISEIHNIKLFLRNGYHSWDGSSYEEPENSLGILPPDACLIQGYGMTQLIPRFGEGSMVIGFDRHDRFQQLFSFSVDKIPVSLAIQTCWDQKETVVGMVNTSEWLELFDHNEVEEALRVWARMVAQSSPIKPRLQTPPITGWCSWYNLYGYISEKVILDHLESFRMENGTDRSPKHVFQIDDGFTPEMGDWLEVKAQFPNGMKYMMDKIRQAGFIPGLWIAPFMVGNRSNLFREHPDWVLHNRKTGKPMVQWKLYGEQRWFKRSEEYFIMDATHPEAFDYLRAVFRLWKNEWGCEYFKTDFMHFGSVYGPSEVEYHTPGRTRIEIWRSVAEMIRQEIGDSIWLGCGCPLWASVGLVDAVRIGGDVGVVWEGRLSAESLLRDLVTRNFPNQILWQIDPDCILLRDRYHYLTQAEVEALAIFAGISGGVIMTSDDFQEMDSSRRSLWRFLLPDNRKRARYPFLGKSSVIYRQDSDQTTSGRPTRMEGMNLDPVIVQVRDGKDRSGPLAVFLFNTGQQPAQRSIPLESIGYHGPLAVYEWGATEQITHNQWHIQATLEPHQGKLFLLCRNPLAQLPDTLP